jgi:nucleotide-binding universal stress UspA family protein
VFKHILIPTDGSVLSAKAVRAAVAFAKQAGARVTGYHALHKVSRGVYGDGYDFASRKDAANLRLHLRRAAVKYVDTIARIARDAGVCFDALVNEAAAPYEGIVNAARSRDCDAIFMASHGRRGLARLTLGSVTHKVLTHSKVPVLVYR